MTNTTDAHARGGRLTWIMLAVTAILAIVGLALFLRDNGRQGEAAVAAASNPLDAEAADRAQSEAAADTSRTLAETGGNIVQGAGDAARATGAAAADAARATEAAVERSTDGDPDSDNNEQP